ncbi:MAG: hypothetical protein QOD42_971 [Sphingomonadales bacterium]|jgi:hypothetical protein|nr:hypothetical protein [Sphingomonadales bacterium]
MKASTGLIAALLASAGLSFAAPPAAAQGIPRALDLSREERAALTALQGTLAGGNAAAQDSALAAARAAARGAAGRYAVAHYQFQIGRGRGDMAMQTQAVNALVESGLATPEELPGLLSFQAGRALAAGNAEQTDRLLARLVQLQPNNPAVLVDYGQFTASQLIVARPAAAERIRANAVALFQRALAANEAAGRLSPEGWHLRALAIAYDGTRPPVANMAFAPAAIALARALVAAYPTPANWRDALLVYRELSTDPALALDLARLMRASQALAGERDYMELAETFAQANMVGEAKAVIDEGVSRNMVETARIPPRLAPRIAARAVAADRAALPGLRARAQAGADGGPARAAADNYFAYGQYAEAAELYRLALQKGGEDPNLVNSRLGAALALAGRKPEAEAALRAVTGPRAELAGFWLAWLARRPV